MCHLGKKKKKHSDCFCYIQAFISGRSSSAALCGSLSLSTSPHPPCFSQGPSSLQHCRYTIPPSLSPSTLTTISCNSVRREAPPWGKSDWSWIRVRELISPCLLLCSQRGSAHQWKHSTFWQGHASSPEDDLIHLFLRLLRLLRIASDLRLFAPPTSHSQLSHNVYSAHFTLPVISHCLLHPLHIPNNQTLSASPTSHSQKSHIVGSTQFTLPVISHCFTPPTSHSQWSHMVCSTHFTLPVISHHLLHPLYIPNEPTLPLCLAIVLTLFAPPTSHSQPSRLVCSAHFTLPTNSYWLLRPFHITNKLVLIAQPTFHYQQSHLVCSSHFTMLTNSYWLLHPHYITNDLPLFAPPMIPFVTDIESLRFPQMLHMMNTFVFRFYTNKRFDLDLEFIFFHKSPHTHTDTHKNVLHICLFLFIAPSHVHPTHWTEGCNLQQLHHHSWAPNQARCSSVRVNGFFFYSIF